MPSIKVSVKWQKELFENLEIDLDQPPVVFKTQLFSLTGVATERQKIMVKGGILQDDGDWNKAGVKNGQKLMMMGTADKVPEAPKEQLVFMEDLPETEQDHTGLKKYGAGLANLGNTCYMNSTLQCLYNVPELKRGLQVFPEAGAMDPGTRLVTSAKKLFSDIERSAQPIPPVQFLLALRDKYPQFAQQTPQGFYMQQDAEECWTQLLYSLREKLKDDNASESLVQNLFGVKAHTRLVCEESGEAIEDDSTSFALKCNISIDINHLSEGIELGLRDDREKNSEKLGRLAVFKGSSKITRLPPYLTVQMVRFFYKVDTQQKAKILRKVTFPLLLDCYDLCSEEYKAQLAGPRAAAKAAEEAQLGLSKKQKLEEGKEQDKAGGKVDEGAERMDLDASSSEDPVEKYKGQATGKYDLVAVLTHKGRSADSGHYVSWVKQDDGQWIQFDDDEMIPRKEEEIQTLSGGGDWHMAYMLLYRAQRV